VKFSSTAFAICIAPDWDRSPNTVKMIVKSPQARPKSRRRLAIVLSFKNLLFSNVPIPARIYDFASVFTPPRKSARSRAAPSRWGRLPNTMRES